MNTQQRILKESIGLFKKFGIKNVTMDYISSELRISKRTIYELFKDKDDLVIQSIKAEAIEEKKEMLEMINKSKNLIEALYQIKKAGHGKMIGANPAFFKDLKMHYPKVFKMVNSKSEIRNDTITITLLKKGVEEGVFRDGLNIEIVNDFLHKIIEVVHDNDTFIRTVSREEIMKNTILHYLRGISTGKGQRLIDKHFSKAEI